MITASHNSNEYNGIKIYNKNGSILEDKYTSIIEKNFMFFTKKEKKYKKTIKKGKIIKLPKD